MAKCLVELTFIANVKTWRGPGPGGGGGGGGGGTAVPRKKCPRHGGDNNS